MFLKEEIEAAKKLFLLIHDHRYDFIYKVSKDSKDWSDSDWKTVVEGFNSKTQKRFIPALSDTAILDVINGKTTSIHSGFKRINGVEYLGVRFGKYTSYFVVDIDNKPLVENPNHNIETVHRIIEITKYIGTPVFMRSSYSSGWHLRWYFDKPVITFEIASYLKDLFESNGFTLSAGKLEIFPNRKSTPEALYNGIRLPCQKRSALLGLEDGRVLADWSEDPETFLSHWAEEVTKNLISTNSLSSLINSNSKNPKYQTWHKEYLDIKEKGFTASSQTNYILCKMAKGVIVFEEITDVQEITKRLCKWIDDKNNGWSEEYNQDPKLAYCWCKRWAVCSLKKYKPLNKTVKKPVKNNSKRALSAQYEHQLEKALKDSLITSEMSIRRIALMTGIPKSVVQRRLNNSIVKR